MFNFDGGKEITAMFFYGETQAVKYAKKITTKEQKPVVIVKLPKGFLVIEQDKMK